MIHRVLEEEIYRKTISFIEIDYSQLEENYIERYINIDNKNLGINRHTKRAYRAYKKKVREELIRYTGEYRSNKYMKTYEKDIRICMNKGYTPEHTAIILNSY